MNALARRLGRLENQIISAERPRQRLRIMVRGTGTRPRLEDATCTRSLCADGTILEVVRIMKHNNVRGDLTAEQLDQWVETFPVLDLRRKNTGHLTYGLR